MNSQWKIDVLWTGEVLKNHPSTFARRLQGLRELSKSNKVDTNLST